MYTWKQTLMLNIFLNHCLPYFLETRSLPEPGTHQFCYTSVQKTPRIVLSLLPSAGITNIACSHAWPFIWVGNLGPHEVANTLPSYLPTPLI